jgi:hypothetical protein
MKKQVIAVILLGILLGCNQQPTDKKPAAQAATSKQPSVVNVQKRIRPDEDAEFSNAYGDGAYVKNATGQARSHVSSLPDNLKTNGSNEAEDQVSDEEINSIKMKSTGLKTWDEQN